MYVVDDYCNCVRFFDGILWSSGFTSWWFDKCLAIGYQCENNCLGVIHQVRNACDGGRGCRQTLRFVTMGERRSLTFITKRKIKCLDDLDDLLVRYFEFGTARVAFRLVAASLKGSGGSERNDTHSARHLSSRTIRACDKRLIIESSYTSSHTSESETNG